MRTRHARRIVPPLMLALLLGCGGGDSPAPTPTVPTFTLRGQVVNAANTNPILGATVDIVDGPNMGKAATTDSDGRYSLTGLTVAAYTVRARAQGFVDNAQSFRLEGDETLNFGMSVVP